MATLLLDVRLGHDLGGQVQPLAKVVEALGREGVVVPLPAELGLEEAARGERLAGLDDVEVLGVDFAVLGLVEVLLGDEDAFAEEVRVDRFAVGFGNQPDELLAGLCQSCDGGLLSYILTVLSGVIDGVGGVKVGLGRKNVNMCARGAASLGVRQVPRGHNCRNLQL